MTTLREAAQQALEAMDKATRFMSDADYRKLNEAIDALKAALVEDAMQKFTDVNQELEAALVEPVQEPVAGRAFLERILTAMEGVIDVADRKTDEFDALRSCVIDLTLMLHTAPPQRKPLTEWQINDLMADIDPEDGDSWSFRQGVYAAEKHHGVRK